MDTNKLSGQPNKRLIHNLYPNQGRERSNTALCFMLKELPLEAIDSQWHVCESHFKTRCHLKELIDDQAFMPLVQMVLNIQALKQKLYVSSYSCAKRNLEYSWKSFCG